MKAAIKREQCQACLNIAKREQARCETSKIKNERLKISLTSYFLHLTSYFSPLSYACTQSEPFGQRVQTVWTACPDYSDGLREPSSSPPYRVFFFYLFAAKTVTFYDLTKYLPDKM